MNNAGRAPTGCDRIAINCDRLGRSKKRDQVGDFVGPDHSACEIGCGQPTLDLVRGDTVRVGLPFDELSSLFGAGTTGVHADHRDSRCISAKIGSLVISASAGRLALAAHCGGAIDENIDAVELAEHLGYGALDGVNQRRCVSKGSCG
jgi:hypothetical protein